MGKFSGRYGAVKLLFTLMIISVAAYGGWWAWNRWFSERANPSMELYPVRGIDISAHNGRVDFARLREDSTLQFVYIKATEGADFLDRNFVANSCGLEREGIAAGAYHFFRFDSDGEMQAWNFIHALRRRGFVLPPAIDVEEWGNPEDISTSRVVGNLKKMIFVMQQHGYEPVIYTNKDGYRRFVKGRFEELPLWICSFTDPPLDDANKLRWDIWQFSHRGTPSGTEGYVDLDLVNPKSPVARILEAAKEKK